MRPRYSFSVPHFRPANPPPTPRPAFTLAPEILHTTGRQIIAALQGHHSDGLRLADLAQKIGLSLADQADNLQLSETIAYLKQTGQIKGGWRINGQNNHSVVVYRPTR